MANYLQALGLSAIFASAAFATGWTDYSVNLGRGYELVRTNADNILIFREGSGFVVPPKITGLNAHRAIVFGIVERQPWTDASSVPGFFVLHTKTGAVQIGLDKETWLTSLRGLGISKEPSLRKPSRFFMLRIYASLFFKSAAVAACIALLIVTAYAMWNKRCKRGSPSGVAEEHPA